MSIQELRRPLHLTTMRVVLVVLLISAVHSDCNFSSGYAAVYFYGWFEDAWGGFGGSSCPRLRCDSATQTLWLLTKHEVIRRRRVKHNRFQEKLFRSYCMVLTPDGNYSRYARTGYRSYDSRFSTKIQDYFYWVDVGQNNSEGVSEYNACLDYCGRTCSELADDKDGRFQQLYQAVNSQPSEYPDICFDDSLTFVQDNDYFTTGWWVSAGFIVAFFLVPIMLAICVSKRCCCLYHKLNVLRNSFSDLFPWLHRILNSCCIRDCEFVATLCRSCLRSRCSACRCSTRCFSAVSREADEGDVEAVVTTQPGVQEEEEEEEEDEVTTSIMNLKPASTTEQFWLIMWQILTTKKRDARGVVKQIFFPPLFFLAIWFVYIVTGISNVGNRWNKSNPNFERKHGDTRDYKRGEILSSGAIEMVTSQIAFVSVMQNVIVTIVVEHRSTLLESARMAGLRDASYWAARFMADGVLLGFVTATLVAVVGAPGLFRFAGHAEYYGGPLAPFGLLFLTHWVYIVALVAFCFVAAVVIPNSMIASLFSVVVQISVIVIAFRCARDSRGQLVSIFEVSPKIQRYWAFLPQFAYWLIIVSFMSNRERFCRIRALVDGHAFLGEKYECHWGEEDEDYAVDWRDAPLKFRNALQGFLDMNDVECPLDEADDSVYYNGTVYADECSVHGPFSEYPSFFKDDTPKTSWIGGLFGMMVLDVFLYIMLAWYLNAVAPWSKYGTPRPWYFVFTPSFWRSIVCGTDLDPVNGNDAYESLTSLSQPEHDGAEVEPRSPVSASEIMVSVVNLHKTYEKEVRAVNGVSFTIAKSEIFCLLGHNGAGKTTTIACLTGLLTPDRRQDTNISVLGREVLSAEGMHLLRATLGVCPQHDILYPKLTCAEHIIFFSRLKGKSKRAAMRDAANLLQLFHLTERAAHLASELSGGQKRKLSTSIALSGRSRVIVLDEPTAGMDPVARRELWTLLRTVRRDRAMLLTTHHMDEAQVLGDRVAVMVAGHVAANGTLPFLMRRHSPYKPIGAPADADAYRLQIWLGDGGYDRHLDELVLGSPEKVGFASRLTYDHELTDGPPTDRKVGNARCIKYNVALSNDDDLHYMARVLKTLANTEPGAVEHYSVMATTLEDVFLQIGKSAEIHNVAKAEAEGAETEFVRRHSWRDIALEDCDRGLSAPLNRETATDRFETTLTAVRRQVVAIHYLRSRLNVRSVRAYAIALTPSVTVVVVVALAKYGILDSSNSWGSRSNVIVALVVVGVYIVIPGLIAHPLVHERNMRLRNLLSISGCDTRAFWGGTLLSDASLVLISVMVALLSFAAFGMAYRHQDRKHVDSYIYDDETHSRIVESESDLTRDYERRLWVTEEPWLWVFLPVFAFSLCAFAHFFSFAFSLPMACVGAFPIMNIVGFILCPLVFIATFVLIFGGYLSGTDRIKIVDWSFEQLICAFAWLTAVMSPIGNLFTFMLRVTNLSFIPDQQEQDPTWPSYWGSFALLWFQLLTFEGLAYIKDRISTRPLRYVKSRFSQVQCNRLDHDVLAERERVLRMLEQTTGPLDNERINEPLLGHGTVLHRLVSWLKRMFYPAAVFANEVTIALLDEIPVVDQPPPLDPQLDPTEVPGFAAFELRKIFPPKRYGAVAVEAVKNVTFAVKRGECFGLLGSNGAGKTTTLSMACRVLEPTSGDAKIAGISSLTKFGRASSHLAVVNQMNTLWETLSCTDHVRFFAQLRLSTDPDVDSRNVEALHRFVNATLAAVEMDKHSAKLAGRLSGGMKRKLCCACALVANPQVIMLDEPSAGLDPVSQRNLWNLIKGTMLGRSVVLTTHSMLEAEVLCDRIAIMTHGQIKCLGTPGHLKARYTSGYDLVLKLKESSSVAAAQASHPEETPVQNGHGQETNSSGDAYSHICDFVEGALKDGDRKPQLLATDAGTLTYELSAGGDSNLLRGILPRVFSSFDASTRERLGIVNFVVKPASMEKVFLNIVAESERQDRQQQLQAAQLGRHVANELERDEDEDDLTLVRFSEPTCCCCSRLHWRCHSLLVFRHLRVFRQLRRMHSKHGSQQPVFFREPRSGLRRRIAVPRDFINEYLRKRNFWAPDD